MASSERERAKHIIVEIIRQAHGQFKKKTNLFKAFYHAHLNFSQNNPGFLSTWPIVKMPQGPGIHDADQLIAELVADGTISEREVQMGDHPGRVYVLQGFGLCCGSFSDEEIAAIKYGVSKVDGRSARDVSDESHAESLSWRITERQGDELNVYIDDLSEEEYNAKIEKMRMLDAGIQQ